MYKPIQYRTAVFIKSSLKYAPKSKEKNENLNTSKNLHAHRMHNNDPFLVKQARRRNNFSLPPPPHPSL